VSGFSGKPSGAPYEPAFIVHPAYLLYIEAAQSRIRLGSLPGAALLDDVDAPLMALVETCARGPATVSELTSALESHWPSITFDIVEATVDTLLAERILVRADDAALVADDEDGMSRQRLFLSLLAPLEEVPAEQQAIEKAAVTIIGVGAIGSVVATLLARAGIRRFRLVDGDHVERSNLHRQILFGYPDIGRWKVSAAADALRRFRPDCEVQEDIRLISSAAQAEECMAGSDIVVCTADMPRREIRQWVNEAAVRHVVPVAFGGLLETACLVGPLVLPHVTACWACTVSAMGAQPVPVPRDPPTAPAWGPLASVAGGLLAGDVLRLVGGVVEPSTLGATVIFDPARQTVTRTPWPANRECPVCACPTGVPSVAASTR
jgi:molybdopterin/thiamine biosynthesis adenylyltransferase